MPTPQEIQDAKLAKFQADRRAQGTPAGATPAQPAPIVKAPDMNTIDSATGKPISESPEQVQYNILPESVTGVKPGTINPYIAPTLQAKIDAKNAPKPVETPAVVPETTPIVPKATELPWVEGPDGQLVRNPNVSDQEVLGFKWDENRKRGSADERGKKVMQSFGDKWGSMTEEQKRQAYIDYKEPEIKVPNTVIGEQQQQKQEVSDVEKQAQATGIPYTMQNGQPVYNATTKDDALKVLQMGGKLAGETKLNAVAQASLDKVRGFAQMTDQQLANNIALGKVSSKDLELLNQINPNLVAKAQEFSKKKVITNTTNEVQAVNNSIINGGEYDGVSTPLKELLTKLTTIDADQRSPAEMKAQYEASHPEMVTARDTINTLQTKKREVERAKRDLWDEYKASHSSMPISMILAGYNIASKSLDDQMYSINDNLNTEISNYNSYLDEMKTEMDWEIAQQGKQEERLWNIYGVTNAAQIRQEDIQREDARIEQSIALEEARYQRDIEREDFKSAEARKQKIEDMKMEMNMNIETGLMNLGVDPTGMTPEEMRASYARATGNQIAYDNALAAAKLGTTGSANGLSGNIPAGDLAAYSMNKRGRQTLQCGELANDSWEKMTGTQLGAGNSYDSKLKAIQKVGQSSGPVAGGIFAFPVETFAGNTGHMGVVKSVNPDGSITVLEANRKENSPNGGVPTEGTYTAGQVKNMVFSVSGGNPNAGAYTDSDIELLSELANMDASARNTALKAQGIPLKAVTDYMAAAKAGQIPPSEAQKQSSAQIMSQIQDLAGMDWNDATGFHVFDPVAGTDYATAKGKIESLIAAITLPNLGMLKGPMSDKDLAFIQNASTRLNLAQTDKEFEKQLIELYNISARKNGMSEITKLSQIPKGRILPGQSGSNYTPQEEALIQELAQNGATDEEIDQALNQYRSNG